MCISGHLSIPLTNNNFSVLEFLMGFHVNLMYQMDFGSQPLIPLARKKIPIWQFLLFLDLEFLGLF